MKRVLWTVAAVVVLLSCLEAQRPRRILESDPAVRDGPLKAKEEPEQTPEEALEMSAADKAYFARLEEKLKQYIPEEQEKEKRESAVGEIKEVPVDFVFPAFEVRAFDAERAMEEEMERNPERFFTYEGWGERMMAKHLDSIDTELLNRWVLPWGESAQARAIRLEQWEKNREWEADMKRMINILDAYEIPDARALESGLSEDFYQRR
ncbi:MAG: hypothetical protein Q7P63_10040 [Verrucomicrobiota bacterium JB022]|nr:hypothetical protein [Verrucomicrobiota bacterium JB022]